jgi:SAM-dependent methyltransferase
MAPDARSDLALDQREDPDEPLGGRNLVAGWDEAHRHSPAPRHRRRVIRDIVRPLGARDVLDAGCGQPFLIDDLVRTLGVQGFGCDISDEAMAAAARDFPSVEFRALDLARERWPEARTFDLVICSEVLEHVPDWEAALEGVVAMSARHVLITVPGGRLRKHDEIVGHIRHFDGPMVSDALRRRGCDVQLVKRWGFPFHTLYRTLINVIGAERMYDQFGSDRPYTRAQRLLSNVLYGVFYVNDRFSSGEQLYVLARKRDAA